MAISPISYQNYQSNNINFKGTNLVNVAQKQKKNLKAVFLGLAGLLGYKVIKDNNKDFQVTAIGAGKEGILIDYIDSNGKLNFEFFKQTEKEKMMDFLSENYGIELEKNNTSTESDNKAISIKEDNNGVSVYVGQRGEFIPTFYLTKKEPQQKQQSPMITSLREQYIPKIRNRAETTGQQVKTELSQGIKDLISQGIMTQKEAEMFNEIYNLEGEEFATKAYDLIARNMGFKDYPTLRFVPLRPCDLGVCYGAEIAVNSTRNFSKGELLGVIRHELEHFKQNVEIVKEFGINKFILANLSSIMHMYAEVPGYCNLQYGKYWKDMGSLKYIAIKEEMDKQFTMGIHSNELTLLQKASGNTEPIKDWKMESFQELESKLCEIETFLADSKMKVSCSKFSTKAEEYLHETSCYISLADLSKVDNPSLFKDLRYTTEEIFTKAQNIFNFYCNCTLESEAKEEEAIIQQKWDAFVKAKKG